MIILNSINSIILVIFMGVLDKFKQSVEKKENISLDKYGEECALCGNKGADKKYLGQYWHTKCLRGVKKQSKKMI
mgnify:CR=1 FL=1